MQAAERRYRSVKTSRDEHVKEMAKIYAELKNIRNLVCECRRKLRDAENTCTEDNEYLRQELNILSIKERQVSQSFEQICKECNMILQDDMKVLPTWIDLKRKYSKAQDKLNACRELEAQSLQAAISGEQQVNLEIANIGTNACSTLL